VHGRVRAVRAAVRLVVVYGSARGSVRRCGSVRQCAAVCGSAHGSV
jgi:hypothetical protein